MDKERKPMFGYVICLIVQWNMVYITIGVYKKGDITNVRNYPSIMVVSLMEKLFGCIIKAQLSA